MTDNLNNTKEKLIQLRNRYLDLMQACLTGRIYRDVSAAPFNAKAFDSHLREHGLDWPAQAQTMIGNQRMANLRALVESVIADQVPGDFIETGVWRGGACIFMRAILFAYCITNRTVWVADSFAGLPEANELDYPADTGSDFHSYSELAVSLEQVQENFRVYNMLDDKVKFLKGWFKDTLPHVPAEQFALIRLDGDMYESTMDALSNLYPKLSTNGYVIIDDYHVVPACKSAVHDYCSSISIEPEIKEIDGVGVYWRKIDPEKPIDEKKNFIQLTDPPDNHIAHLNEALAHLSGQVISYLEQSLANRDNDIKGLNQLLAERTNEIEILSQTLADQETTIAEHKNTIAEHKNTITACENTIKNQVIDINRRDDQIAKLKNNLEQVYASASWRLTKPLRGIKKIVTRN